MSIVLQQEPGDCCIAALAMLLGEKYAEVLAAAVTRKYRRPHRGMYTAKQLQAVARRLNAELVLRRTFDLENDCGLLTLDKIEREPNDYAQHIVLLRYGLIFDTDGVVYEPDFYCEQFKYRPVSLLVRKDPA